MDSPAAWECIKQNGGMIVRETLLKEGLSLHKEIHDENED